MDITNADGTPGRLSYVVGDDAAVLLATFVFEPPAGSAGRPIGVEIEVRGRPADIDKKVNEISGMIDSTTYRVSGQEATS